ncbi:MAG: hypothetical protein FWG66_06505 [Spirochaetes bacterium]|nr:hypothetical protein [Spirochaetota bacterium]
MKKPLVFCLMPFLLAAALGACRTTSFLEPLTPELLERMGDPDSVQISGFQFALSSRVRLEGYIQPQHPVAMDGRTAVLLGDVRQSVTINAQTEGQAVNIQRLYDRINIQVSFEENPHLFLNFTAATFDGDGVFELVYEPRLQRRRFGDWFFSRRRGSLDYGGIDHELVYSPGRHRPQLLIMMRMENEVREVSRVAPGRVIMTDDDP